MTRPKPIPPDPHAGHLQVVVSFRLRLHDALRHATIEQLRNGLVEMTYRNGGGLGELADLDVAVRVIGAGSERSETEGVGP